MVAALEQILHGLNQQMLSVAVYRESVNRLPLKGIELECLDSEVAQ